MAVQAGAGMQRARRIIVPVSASLALSLSPTLSNRAFPNRLFQMVYLLNRSKANAVQVTESASIAVCLSVRIPEIFR